MSTNGSLIYIYIARLNTKITVAEYPFNIPEKIVSDSRILLDKLIQNNYKHYDERNVISVDNGCYYFLVTKANLFFFSKIK